MKVVILGKGEMLANLIEGTLQGGHEIAAVFRYERTALNPVRLFFYDFFKSSSAYTLIKKYKLKEIKLKSANCKAFKNELIHLNTDILLVGTWGEKLKKEITDVPKIASVNVHPSLLPKYRGPNPYLQAIKNLEKKSGVTFHLIDDNYDTGAILDQKSVDILPSDTGGDLREKTVYLARLMLVPLLKRLEHGLISPQAQNENEASYFNNVSADDMMIDFKKENAEQIHARIRALHPWLPCYIQYNNNFFITNPYHLKIIDTECKEPGKIIDKCTRTNSMTIVCADGKALKMSGLKLFGLFKPFTKLYLEKFVKI